MRIIKLIRWLANEEEEEGGKERKKEKKDEGEYEIIFTS